MCVTGVDISARMLAEAATLTRDAAVCYRHQAIEDFIAPPATFDLVVSSLALHYVDDYASVVDHVFHALKPGGGFLFSVEHPMCTAHPVGWVRDEVGLPLHWPVDRYQQEGRRDTRWFVDGVVKYHRTIETYVNTLIGAGFLLDHIGEPVPLPAALASRPGLREDGRRPPFLLLRARRP